MTPSTKTQNLALWGAALGVSVLLAFLSGIATHWPEQGSIDWRGVVLDVIQVLLSVIPVAAAGLGLPRLGKEGVASLVSEVGKEQAIAALEIEADRQAGIPSTVITVEQRAMILSDLKRELTRDPEGDDPVLFGDGPKEKLRG